MKRQTVIATFAAATWLITCHSGIAGTANLTWTPPTQNDDGSPLTDLTSYELHYGCQSSGSYDSVETIPAGGFSYTVTGLPDTGTCYFNLKAVNSAGIASAFSGEASKLMGALALSGPVENLQIAWQETQAPSAIYQLPETDFGPYIDAGNFNVGPNSLDIQFTITPDTYPTNWSRIISKATGSASQAHTFMVSMHYGKLRFRLKTNGNTTTLVGASTIPLGVTTQGRATYDGSNMQIFVNGVLDSSVSKTGPIDQNNDPVFVGANPPNGGDAFDGRIAVTVN